MEYYDKKDMIIRLTDAVSQLFSNCIEPNEYQVAKLATAEFLVATSLSPEDAIEVMQDAQGVDAASDDCLNELIEEFMGQIE